MKKELYKSDKCLQDYFFINNGPINIETRANQELVEGLARQGQRDKRISACVQRNIELFHFCPSSNFRFRFIPAATYRSVNFFREQNERGKGSVARSEMLASQREKKKRVKTDTSAIKD